MKKYVITGATGNIGKVISKELLSKGENVKVIGRNKEKMSDLIAMGAEAVIGNITDRAFLIHSFADADVIFCLLTPNMHSNEVFNEQKQIAENYFEAVKKSKAQHIVLLSSIGAHLRKGAGIVDGLGYMEELFLQLKDRHILNLRPSYFMENTFGLIGVIKHMGISGNPVKGDIKFPFVATHDIGKFAAKRMLELNFKGNTIEYILGAKDYSYDEITAIIGKAIGKPDLKYVQFPYEDAAIGMVSSGFCSEDAARLMIDLAKLINSGNLSIDVKRSASNTTQTTYEEFVNTFVWVYQNS